MTMTRMKNNPLTCKAASFSPNVWIETTDFQDIATNYIKSDTLNYFSGVHGITCKSDVSSHLVLKVDDSHPYRGHTSHPGSKRMPLTLRCCEPVWQISVCVGKSQLEAAVDGSDSCVGIKLLRAPILTLVIMCKLANRTHYNNLVVQCNVSEGAETLFFSSL